MKKFEPHYRLVRYGMASKIEKASRQQRTCSRSLKGYRRNLREQSVQWMYTDGPQASSARTGRRSTGARPRPRAERRRQTNKRIAHEGDSRGGVVFLGRVLHDGLGIALAIVYSYESLKSSCAWHCTARWVAFEIIMSSLSLHQCISWTFRLPTYTTFTKQLLSILSGRDLPTLTRPFQLVAFIYLSKSCTRLNHNSKVPTVELSTYYAMSRSYFQQCFPKQQRNLSKQLIHILHVSAIHSF
jgi:hypothetical protein